MRRLIAQFARFGVVGGVGLVVDFGLFNLLRATVLGPEDLHEGPLIAKIISTIAAIVCNWVGNRLWTFREHRGPRLAHEGIRFALVSVGGMLIGLACLWVSHHALGLTSALADNVSSYVIGLPLGTLFRFWLYRSWVFAPRRTEQSVSEQAVTEQAVTEQVVTDDRGRRFAASGPPDGATPPGSSSPP